jgi:hypothetical protein
MSVRGQDAIIARKMNEMQSCEQHPCRSKIRPSGLTAIKPLAIADIKGRLRNASSEMQQNKRSELAKDSGTQSSKPTTGLTRLIDE